MSNIIVTSVRISPETAALSGEELMVELTKVFDAAKLDCFKAICKDNPVEDCECGCNDKCAIHGQFYTGPVIGCGAPAHNPTEKETKE